LDKCINDFKNLIGRGRNRIILRRRNVLGSYLAQGLPYIRHAADVFARSVAILRDWNEGKYTVDEDEVSMLQSVAFSSLMKEAK
jgi:hypothetical protein